MKTRNGIATRPYRFLAVLAALTACSTAFAQDDGHRGPAHQHFDNRFSHNHYYFDRGYGVLRVPHNSYAIVHGRDHFFYDRGQWFRRGDRGFVVVGAPLGGFVPVLPPFYTTVWFGGLPYYYANDTYYTWDARQHGYEVVAPPSDIETAGTTQPPLSDNLFVYPKNGQSSETQERDRYECHHSAVEQTGYDPTQANGGVAPERAAGKRADYFRAQAACLDARGYSVK